MKALSEQLAADNVVEILRRSGPKRRNGVRTRTKNNVRNGLGSGARATTAATASKPKSRGRKTVAKMTDNPYVSKFFKKKKDNAS